MRVSLFSFLFVQLVCELVFVLRDFFFQEESVIYIDGILKLLNRVCNSLMLCARLSVREPSMLVHSSPALKLQSYSLSLEFGALLISLINFSLGTKAYLHLTDIQVSVLLLVV